MIFSLPEDKPDGVDATFRFKTAERSQKMRRYYYRGRQFVRLHVLFIYSISCDVLLMIAKLIYRTVDDNINRLIFYDNTNFEIFPWQIYIYIYIIWITKRVRAFVSISNIRKKRIVKSKIIVRSTTSTVRLASEFALGQRKCVHLSRGLSPC